MAQNVTDLSVVRAISPESGSILLISSSNPLQNTENGVIKQQTEPPFDPE